jgi:signal peptidase II
MPGHPHKGNPKPAAFVARVRSLTKTLYGILAFLILLCDQWTKALVEQSIPEHSVIPIFPRILNLTHVKNPGVAFGLFADSPAPWKTALLVAVSGALLVGVIVLVWRTRNLAWESGVGLSLILGGALSNLLDRIRWGRVVDFVDLYVRSYHWPAFNLADSAIVVGAGVLILHYLFSKSPSHEQRPC